jgi:hypothetical protein
MSNSLTQEVAEDFFELLYEKGERKATAAQQVTAIDKQIKETKKAFCDSFEISAADVNFAFTRYKKLREGTLDAEDSGVYDLCAMADAAFDKDDVVPVIPATYGSSNGSSPVCGCNVNA